VHPACVQRGFLRSFEVTEGTMQVLIVESNSELADVWQAHLERQGLTVKRALGQTEAIDLLQDSPFGLVVLELVLEHGSAFAVADYANYRYPDMPVILVTNSTFFSDGSIFQHMANARAFITSEVDPDDLTAMVQHYGKNEENEKK
jgi:DNA-binding NtrC family response regulator